VTVVIRTAAGEIGAASDWGEVGAAVGAVGLSALAGLALLGLVLPGEAVAGAV